MVDGLALGEVLGLVDVLALGLVNGLALALALGGGEQSHDRQRSDRCSAIEHEPCSGAGLVRSLGGGGLVRRPGAAVVAGDEAQQRLACDGGDGAAAGRSHGVPGVPGVPAGVVVALAAPDAFHHAGRPGPTGCTTWPW